MSIIYDALQKAQEKGSRPTSSTEISFQNLSVKNHKWLLFLIIPLLIAIIILLQIQKFSLWFNYLNHPIVLTQQTQPSASERLAATPNPLVLKGIVLSGSESIAFINEQALTIGDEIQGMKMIAMDDKKVVLKKDKQLIELKVNLI